MSPIARTRSFGGCSTVRIDGSIHIDHADKVQCRRRRMKCDEGRPQCLACINSGLKCGSYEKSLFFDSDKSSSDDQFRRLLFTEEEREEMSKWLTTAVPPRLALHQLSRIDVESEKASTLGDIQISRGPFGVFRFAQPEEQVSPADDVHDHVDEARQYDPIFEGVNPTPLMLPSLPEDHAIFPDPISANALVPCDDFTNSMTDKIYVHEIFNALTTPLTSQFSNFTTETHPGFLSNSFTATGQHHPSSPCSDTSIIHNRIPKDAVILLNHYSSTVVKLMTPVQHSRTPWHILFIPLAKNCLAAFTLGEALDHASLCTFYGMLTISALSLSGMTHAPTWAEQAQIYKQQAREHVRMMLKTAYDIPKTAKYKTVLMALLILVQLSIISGIQDQTECYLLEAEKFIRLRGLKRQKSRKVRLLHHCYAFERIFYESLYVGGIGSMHRQHVCQVIESSGLGKHSPDSLSFGLGKWTNLEQEMSKVKDQEAGENDLHLGVPGVWHATLYPEIFGVPELWISLVSLIIRLARTRETDDYRRGSFTPLGLEDFLDRAKVIEQCINQIQPPSQGTELDYLLEAMRLALEIYFYRRIYNVGALLLRSKVDSIRDCLIQYDAASPCGTFGSARLVWPAFVASCEAEDPDLKEFFRLWFRQAARNSGLSLFTVALSNVERIWDAKNNNDGTGNSWVELLKMRDNDPGIPVGYTY